MTALLPSWKQLRALTGSPSSSLRSLWSVLRNVPGGGRLMGTLVGRMARYTGTVRPEVLALETGYAKVRIDDTKAVRNHLNSVHAVALMNLGEAVTGLAVLFALPEGARGIVTHLGMDYLKKARGRITAEARCEVPALSERTTCQFTADLRDESGEVVARVQATWLISVKA
jgi:acyl-coenzyme A thioesterase PaaI-like protein